MKKLMSVLLAVVMLASFGCFGVSAASDVDLLKHGVVSNNNDFCTVSKMSDGGYEAVVTKAWNSTTDAAFGFAVEPQVTGTDMTGMYVHMSIVSDVPFRISHLDRSAGVDKWIVYTGEFFNSVYPKGASGGTVESLVNEKFFPAGTYECVAFLGGVYNFKTENGEAGWDIKNADITGLYIEAMEAGTMKLNSLKLSTDTEFSGKPVEDNNAPNPEKKTTTAKKTTTTKKAGANDVKEDGANTGDVSKAALFLMVAAVATTAVTLSVVSSKAKNR